MQAPRSKRRPAADLAGVAVGGAAPVRIMAVVNVSPESFYSGSVRRGRGALRAAAQEAVEAGADFIDVGAMSSAPYLATDIPAAEERKRLTWALEVVAGAVSVPLSADTARAEVARAALDSGARIVNDVTGLRGDARMADVAAVAEGIVVVAAASGRGGRVSLARVLALLRGSLTLAQRAGVPLRRMVVDPGIGFFPAASPPPDVFNCRLLAGLEALRRLDRPVLVGVSRKSFIGRLTGKADPAQRLPGSLGATAIAVYNGAAIVRTHDAAATRDAVRVAEAIAAQRR
jgi:dihydropteroate synthase